MLQCVHHFTLKHTLFNCALFLYLTTFYSCVVCTGLRMSAVLHTAKREHMQLFITAVRCHTRVALRLPEQLQAIDGATTG
jgi:hypothetical protein